MNKTFKIRRQQSLLFAPSHPTRSVFDMPVDFDPRKSYAVQRRNQVIPGPAHYGVASQEQYLKNTYTKSVQQVPFYLNMKIPKIYRERDPGYRDRGGDNYLE